MHVLYIDYLFNQSIWKGLQENNVNSIIVNIWIKKSMSHLLKPISYTVHHRLLAACLTLSALTLNFHNSVRETLSFILSEGSKVTCPNSHKLACG
jgi:hypothetical protein